MDKPLTKNSRIEKLSHVLTILAVVILFNALVSFLAVKKAKRAEEPVRLCEESKWAWVRASQKLEGNLHQWSRLGVECLRAGFRPIERRDEDGSFLFRRLLASEPIVGQPKFPYVAVAAEADLVPGKTAALCYAGAFLPVELKKVNPGEGSTTVQLDFPGGVSIPSHVNRFFLIQYEEIRLALRERKTSDDMFLAEEDRNGTVRPLVARLDDFHAMYSLGEFGDEILARFAFSEAECRWEREVEISLAADALQGKEWILQDNDLFSKALVTEGESN